MIELASLNRFKEDSKKRAVESTRAHECDVPCVNTYVFSWAHYLPFFSAQHNSIAVTLSVACQEEGVFVSLGITALRCRSVFVKGK